MMHKDNKKHYNQALLVFFLHHFLKKISFSAKKALCSPHKSILNKNLPTAHIHNSKHLINITKSNNKRHREQIQEF